MPTIADYSSLAELAGQKQPTAGGGCGCDGACGGSDLVSLERTHFFPRQLVGPDDLIQDQIYFRDKLRRHNRLLHGWGIVCGAGVEGGEKPCEVTVKPGYVLGPYGDEIVIDGEVTFDVCSQGPSLDPCGGIDPWCTDVRARRREGQTLYLAIRATECDTRPVRVTACGCGCDDAECEYSRTRDSFELAALTELPDTYSTTKRESALTGLLGLLGAFTCVLGPRSCPACPSSPWVVLADLTLDAGGMVTPDCPPHRRYVASFADFWFSCTETRTGSLGALTGMLGKTGPNMYMDERTMEYAAGTAPPPAATVAARRGDGSWVTVPGTFEVKPGETLREMVAREGDRTLVDGASGHTVTIRELFAAAGADPEAKLGSVADALSQLEAKKIDVPSLRVVRGSFEEAIDVHGLEKLDELGGSPAIAPELPATALRGVETESAVAAYVAGKTVAEVATQPLSRFVSAATKGLEASEREVEAERARAVWENAQRVETLGTAWRGGQA